MIPTHQYDEQDTRMDKQADSTGAATASANRPAHTPGPWVWVYYPDGRKILCASECAVIHCPDAPMAVEPADAALLAAAPELLKALKAAHSFIANGIEFGYIQMPDADCPDTAHNTPGMVRAAIEKAERGQ